jgi:hypothetical protein
MLKKLLILPLLISTSVMATVVLENGDASEEANMCIEAVMDENFKFNAKNEKVTCNGINIKDFTKKYRERKQEASESKIAVFQLEATDSNIETQLCIAAAGGKQKLIALAKEVKYDDYNKVRCNGKSINEFARNLMK